MGHVPELQENTTHDGGDPPPASVVPAAVLAPAAAEPTAGGASRRHSEILETLGGQICSGELPPLCVLNTDELEARFAVSRTLVREVLRVLATMGLVEARRRVGTVVLPEPRWDAFNPQVIRWKLASPARLTQLRELTELRNAVEPLAAMLAAERADTAERAEIVRLAAAMWAAGKTGRQQEFLELDIEFHHAVLAGSRNQMIATLHQITQEVLAGRVQYGLMPQLPDHAALEWHMDVAVAIQHGDGRAARAAMEKIVEQSFVEMAHMWDAPGAASGSLNRNPSALR